MAPDPNSKSGQLRNANGHVFSSGNGVHITVDLETVSTEELMREIEKRTTADGE